MSIGSPFHEWNGCSADIRDYREQKGIRSAKRSSRSTRKKIGGKCSAFKPFQWSGVSQRSHMVEGALAPTMTVPFHSLPRGWNDGTMLFQPASKIPPKVLLRAAAPPVRASRHTRHRRKSLFRIGRHHSGHRQNKCQSHPK
jgi:hypothetical protein